MLLLAPHAVSGGEAIALAPGLTITRSVQEDKASYQLGSRLLWSESAGDVSRTWRACRAPDGTVLVAARYATSNGLGVEAWQLTAFRDPGRPYHWLAQDFGADAVRLRRGHMQVLAGQWSWPAHGPDHGSLDYVGGWFQADAAGLSPVGPWLTRPFRFSFEAERDQRWGEPAHWLRPAKARPYPRRDPRLGTHARPPQLHGTLAELKRCDQGLRLTLAGQQLWLDAGTSFPEGSTVVTHVMRHGRVLPWGYAPADVQTWQGHQATLLNYEDANVLVLAD